MCKRLSYCAKKIDPCLLKEVERINAEGKLRTLKSCCGHNKYEPTILVIDNKTKELKEYYSNKILERRKGDRYYRRDKEGYYYVKQLINPIYDN